MIETVYKVNGIEFDNYKAALEYDVKAGAVMCDARGERVYDYTFAAYIITTNEAQTDYMRAKYNINLRGPYGFYVWMGDIGWIKINNDAMKEAAKKFI